MALVFILTENSSHGSHDGTARNLCLAVCLMAINSELLELGRWKSEWRQKFIPQFHVATNLMKTVKSVTPTIRVPIVHVYVIYRSQSVYWLAFGPDDRGSFPGRGRDYFSLPPRPNRLWGPSNLLINGYRSSFLRGKAAGAWSWPLTFSQCQAWNAWSCTSTPPYVFMAWYLVNYRDNFIFTKLTTFVNLT
jgi:hypothetical protein